MKILVSWLRDFVDLTASADEIGRAMSVRGFAVESIEPAEGGDAIIDFEVTANRPDCMSVLGLAREVATAFDVPLRALGDPTSPAPAGLGLATLGLDTLGEGDAGVTVTVEDAELCPRYVGAVAEVTVGASPAWLQARLQAAGVRPISNVVDITNYVLLELGHPMHAFDLRTLGGSAIRVRRARAGETLATLDGQSRTLTHDMLVIADAERAVAVAGVMGGADTEVTAATTTIVFESAYFNPNSVRRTSKKLGLKTEASTRFERGADPNLAAVAMARACALLQAIGAGTPRGTLVDAYVAPIADRHLALRRDRITGVIGTAIPDADVERILGGLGFGLTGTRDGWSVVVPTRRVDALREVDLIEEVARHYGFDRLVGTFPELPAASAAPDPRITQTRGLRQLFTGAGFSEAVTFGFIDAASAAPFASDGDLVPIANPLSETFGVLRPSVVPGLVGAVAYNRRRERRDIRLFEIGNRFLLGTGERRAAACVWTGAAAGEHWSGGAREVDFFDMKGMALRLCEALRVTDGGHTLEVVPHRESWLVHGRSAAVLLNGVRLGVFGQLVPALADARGIPAADAVYVLEFDLDLVDAAALGAPVSVSPLPKYPSVTRDVSVLVDETLPAGQVRQTMQTAGPESLVLVREFDRYQGKGVPDGKVSLSLRLTFRSAERTLRDAEVQEAMTAILDALGREHGAIQR